MVLSHRGIIGIVAMLLPFYKINVTFCANPFDNGMGEWYIDINDWHKNL